MTCPRVRDPLRLLPNLPSPRRPSGAGGWEEYRTEQNAVAWVNHSLSSVRRMMNGDFWKDDILGSPEAVLQSGSGSLLKEIVEERQRIAAALESFTPEGRAKRAGFLGGIPFKTARVVPLVPRGNFRNIWPRIFELRAGTTAASSEGKGN